MKLYLVTSVFLMVHSFSVYAACSFDTPAQRTTESECKFQKLTWANGICTDGSTPIPTTVNLVITAPIGDEIKCGDNADQTCPTNPTKDTPIKLTAKPTTGYQFKSWGINCASQTTSICSLIMSTDKTVSVTFEQITCLTGQALVNGVCTDPTPTTPTCTTGQELVGNQCITTNGLQKLGYPLIVNSSFQTTTSTFFGGISVNGGTPSKENFNVKRNQTISVDGLIVPEHQSVAEIIAVGLYVPPDKLTGRATAKEYCDPVLGDFYMNTASVDFTDNYCNWIVDRFTGQIESTNGCNTPDNRRSALSSNVNDFWNVWSGHLNTLNPMYSKVSLDSNGVSKLLYEDTVNYTSQVCLYFGYRLADQSLIFNGEPIIFRVTQ